jgi:DNA-binding CsgD family transcriptional regulator
LGVALEDVNELIGSIYDSAMQPQTWPATLGRLGELLGDASFVMSALHRTDGMLLGVTTSQDPSATEVLRTRFSLPQNNPLVAAMPALPPGQLVVRRAVHADNAYFRSELYNEIFRHQDLVHQVIACIHRTEDLVCPLGILRPRPAGEFSGEQMEVLRLLLPHLRRAVQLSLRFNAMEASVMAATGALDRVPFGVFLCTGSGRVVHFNGAAEKIVREQDGLWLRHGEFYAWRYQDAASLREAMAAALEKPFEAVAALTLQRRSGKRPYVALVAPAGGRLSAQVLQAPAGVVVFVNDPASAHPGRRPLLRRLFGLSAREAQLAEALLDGKRLDEYAGEENISVNTVRTQLRAIFAKTDTRRQAELMQVLNGASSLAASWP